MRNIFLFLSALMILLICTHCWEINNKPGCIREYEFTLPVSIKPAIDTFHVGDTILLDIIVPALMEENTSLQEKDVSNFVLNDNLLAIGKYFPNKYEFASEKFDYLAIQGIFIKDHPHIYLVFAEESLKSRHFHGYIIPKETGLYRFAFDILTQDQKNGFNDNCLGRGDFFCETNGLDSNNWYLMAPLGESLTADYEDHKKTGGYAFVVVE